MSATAELPATPKSFRVFTIEDLAWLCLFALLGFCQGDNSYNADLVLVVWAVFQVVEPRLRFFTTRSGQLTAILAKILFCYLLVGWTHGINSSLYVIFLLPTILAATVFELAGTIAFIVLSCLAYASFLLFLDWRQLYIPAPQFRLLLFRVSLFPVVGLLVYQQARAKRQEMLRTEAAARQLSESNRTLRRTQVSLRRSERLAALGQLTAGLAHELRNPLGTIKASAELLAQPGTQQKPDVQAELAGYITTEVDRMNSLVSRFLDFARPLQLNPRLSDIRAVLLHSAAQVRPRADARLVQIHTHLPEAAVEFRFDPDLLALAITNLLQNAVDASREGGSVSVNLDTQGDETLVTVTDTGAGIAYEHLENIFNPFFTTKSGGTGLGLALVAKIVDEHQGKITVHSESGRGSSFEVLLPHPVES